MIKIAVRNESTVVNDADFNAMVQAVQIQISRDFAPAWGIDATLVPWPKTQSLPTDMSIVGMLDDSQQAGVLGYHDVTSSGMPLGLVFAKTTLQYHDLVSVSLSHEILEMLADPDVNLLVRVSKGKFFAYEICDAVEADQFGYDIALPSGRTIRVSNFVFPSYFETFLSGKRQYDFNNLLSGHIPAMLAGGYLAFFTEKQGWSQIFKHEHDDFTEADRRAAFKARPYPGSRRARRMLEREEWIRSVVR